MRKTNWLVFYRERRRIMQRVVLVGAKGSGVIEPAELGDQHLHPRVFATSGVGQALNEVGEAMFLSVLP